MPPSPQRAIPSVDRLLHAIAPSDLPRPFVVHVLRQQLAALRTSTTIPDFDTIVADLDQTLAARARQRLQPVVNGTGILAHTNLGRAPLSLTALATLGSVAGGYSNLELDLESGERGPRAAYLEQSIALATGAPAATVVNNCAAALVLILRHFTAGPRKEVVISRGELVQIGGGFRIPDILESSGARLREVGTTNQTTLDDYAQAISSHTALILRVHRSNFFMEGFVHSPSIADLARLARERAPDFGPEGLPLVDDLGSGAWVDLAELASLDHEPQPHESIQAGADLVCFSGDKLLGGPQAGLIVGQTDRIGTLKKDPFFRALRCDKLVFAALQATVESYLHARTTRDAPPPEGIPMLDLMRIPLETLRNRGESILARLRTLAIQVTLGEGHSQIGGGVCPRSHLPSVTLIMRPHNQSVETLSRRLRQHPTPILGFIANDAVQIDLRTVFPHQDEILVQALTSTLSSA